MKIVCQIYSVQSLENFKKKNILGTCTLLSLLILQTVSFEKKN